MRVVSVNHGTHKDAKGGRGTEGIGGCGPRDGYTVRFCIPGAARAVNGINRMTRN